MSAQPTTDPARADPLTLGISPCPNDTFIFRAWVHGRVPGAPPVTVAYADIGECNTLAARGALDIVKVSYGALPWLLADYRLLPCGGALGRGCGPLVLTARPAEPGALPGARIAVPGERTTAYLLLRLWAQAVVPESRGRCLAPASPSPASAPRRTCCCGCGHRRWCRTTSARSW